MENCMAHVVNTHRVRNARDSPIGKTEEGSLKQFRKKVQPELVRVLPTVPAIPSSCLPSSSSSSPPSSLLPSFLSPLRSATDAHADYSAAQCEERVRGRWGCGGVADGGRERGRGKKCSRKV